MEINFNTTNHANKDINLAKRDDASQEGGSWKVNYYDAAGNLELTPGDNLKKTITRAKPFCLCLYKGGCALLLVRIMTSISF